MTTEEKDTVGDGLYDDLDQEAKKWSYLSASKKKISFKDDLLRSARTEVVAMAAGILPSEPTQAEVFDLKKQIKSLKEENENLTKNMGILYRTAKAELERKDAVINMLQEELDSFKR